MQNRGGWLWVVGILGFSAAANAQAPPASAAGTRFDGTYAFVSSTKVNEAYTGSARMIQCLDRKAGPLTIVNGQAQYSGFGLRTPYEFTGTVGSKGELAMQSAAAPVIRGDRPGIEIIVQGRIDGNGTVSARQIGNLCSYDFIWQKVPR